MVAWKPPPRLNTAQQKSEKEEVSLQLQRATSRRFTVILVLSPSTDAPAGNQ